MYHINKYINIPYKTIIVGESNNLANLTVRSNITIIIFNLSYHCLLELWIINIGNLNTGEFSNKSITNDNPNYY